MDPGWQFGHESRSVFGRAEGTEGARGGRDPGKEKGRDRRRAPRGGARLSWRFVDCGEAVPRAAAARPGW